MSIFDLRLETERLVLRPLLREDYEAYLAFCADEETMRTLGGVQPPSVAWRGFCSLAGACSLRCSMFSVIEKSSGQWIGRMGLPQPHWPGSHVGWGQFRQLRMGDAPEAAVAAIDWAFDTLGWDEVIHTIAENNDNSRAVARKLGSTPFRPGELPPPYNDKPMQIPSQSASSGGAERCSVVPAAGRQSLGSCRVEDAGQRPALPCGHAAPALGNHRRACQTARSRPPAGSDGAGDGGRARPVDGAWHVGLGQLPRYACWRKPAVLPPLGGKWTVPMARPTPLNSLH